MESNLDLWSRLDEVLQVDLNPSDRTGIGKLNRLAKKGFAEIRTIGYDLSRENSDIELLDGLTLSTLGEYRLAHDRKGQAATRS